MALITRASTASLDANHAVHAGIMGRAGEALDPASPCQIRADGQIFMSNATAANAAARVDGICPRAALIGETVTLFAENSRFSYGSGLTIGATLFVAATAGRLDDVATAGDAVGVARVVSATDIVFKRTA